MTTITDVIISEITTNSVIIRAHYINKPAKSYIEYGLDIFYGLITPKFPNTYYAEFRIIGLNQSTTYNYKIVADDIFGVRSETTNATFTTLSQLQWESIVKSSRPNSDLPKQYYVSNLNGLNTNPGTESLPFKTIQYAISGTYLGDTVYVMEGTYTNDIIKFPRSGIDIAHITLTTYNNDIAYLIGNSAQEAIAGFVGSHHIDIIGNFDISLCRGGVSFPQSHDIVLKNIKVHDTYGTPIGFGSTIVNGAYNIYIDNCICDTQQPGPSVHGIFIQGDLGTCTSKIVNTEAAMYNVRIENTYVNKYGHNCLDFWSDGKFYFVYNSIFNGSTGQYGVFIHNYNQKYHSINKCTCNANNRGLEINGADHVLVENCTITNNMYYQGILLMIPGGDTFCLPQYPGNNDIIIKDNIIQSNTYDVVLYQLGNGLPIKDILFWGNTIEDSPWITGGSTGQFQNFIFRDTKTNTAGYTFSTPVQNVTIDFLDGTVFTSSLGIPTHYPDRSEVFSALASGGHTQTKYPVAIKPTNGTATAVVNSININQPLGSILIDVTVTYTNTTSSQIIGKTLKPFINYLLKRNTLSIGISTSDINGNVYFIDNLPTPTSRYTIEETVTPPGSISFDSDPQNATIYLNDINTNFYTPHTINDLISGNYKYTLKLTGYENYTNYIDVTPGNTSIVSITLIEIQCPIPICNINVTQLG